MGLYDRDYTRESFGFGSQYAPQMRMNFPRMTPMVKKLLIINVAVFLPCFLIAGLERFIFYWFSVYPATGWMCLQLWRPITYQFLHGGPGHIFMNMLVLYFFGP
ncbi:MAG: rhomboid family intramembrane serine protease, partial [Planctomycetota bacterium]